MNSTLFKYLLRKTYPVILVCLAILIVFYPLPVLFTPVNQNELPLAHGVTTYIYYTKYADTNLFLATIALLIFAYVLPIFIRISVLNKSKCDQYFSLPIKKGKLYLTTSLFTYLSLICTWTMMMLIGIIFSLIKQFPINYLYYLLYILSMYLVSAFAFATSSLFASLGNSKLDVWLLVIMSIIIPLLSGLSIHAVKKQFVEGVYDCISPIMAGNNLTTYFEKMSIIYPQEVVDYYAKININLVDEFGIGHIMSYVGSTVLGTGLFVLSYFQNLKFKAEDAGELTLYPYSFKLLIPILFALVIFDSNIPQYFNENEILNLVFIVSYSTICYFVLFFIIQRKIKVDKWILIYYAIALLGATGLSKLLIK